MHVGTERNLQKPRETLKFVPDTSSTYRYVCPRVFWTITFS